MAKMGQVGTVYITGDNPLSDIQGANSFASRHGTEWKSILVESGVHVAGDEPAHAPDAIVMGIKEAVEWALKDSGMSDMDGSPTKRRRWLVGTRYDSSQSNEVRLRLLPLSFTVSN
jgi:hypothetical protein